MLCCVVMFCLLATTHGDNSVIVSIRKCSVSALWCVSILCLDLSVARSEYAK